MSRYLLVFHGGSIPESQGARYKVMTEWDKWFLDLGPALAESGIGGNAVVRKTALSSNGSVFSGPVASPTSGYTFLETENLDSAIQLAKGSPAMLGGASVEVCETFTVL